MQVTGSSVSRNDIDINWACTIGYIDEKFIMEINQSKMNQLQNITILYLYFFASHLPYQPTILLSNFPRDYSMIVEACMVSHVRLMQARSVGTLQNTITFHRTVETHFLHSQSLETCDYPPYRFGKQLHWCSIYILFSVGCLIHFMPAFVRRDIF